MFVSRIRALAAPDFGSALGAAVHGTKMCAGSRVKCRKRTPAWASNPAGQSCGSGVRLFALVVKPQRQTRSSQHTLLGEILLMAGTEEAGQQCSPGGRQHRERGCELHAAPAFARSPAAHTSWSERHGCGNEHHSSKAPAVHALPAHTATAARSTATWQPSSRSQGAVQCGAMQEEQRGRRG
ncbi:hypothetical protein COCOBI_02-5120 [Coccomyxa sp. Obi]|nr:hypothetical protein COCOBI_02-5120 [Coccomyxa sp. Obi]